jgi:hypothetical protein
VREVLDRFEQRSVELRQLYDLLRSIRTEPGLELFPLKERMLERAIDLARSEILLKPSDQAFITMVDAHVSPLM